MFFAILLLERDMSGRKDLPLGKLRRIFAQMAGNWWAASSPIGIASRIEVPELVGDCLLYPQRRRHGGN
jgi:hypothetical protein